MWEPACGAGHIVNVLRELGHEVSATDIVDRGCPDSCVQDFLWEFDDGEIGDVDIITNPPYATALEFVERALACVKDGANVWMLLRLQFLEGKARRRLFDVAPPLRRVGIQRAADLCEKWGFLQGRRWGDCIRMVPLD